MIWDNIIAGLPKIGIALAAVAAFLGILLILFFVLGRVRGKFANPLAGIMFLGPAILLLIIGLVVPTVQTISKSFFNASGQKFVGLANYGWIFTTENNQKVLINTALWIIVAPLFSTAVGLLLALLLDKMKRESIPKSLIFMPMAISFVGASIIWGLVYAYRDPSQEQVGLLSQVVLWLGMEPPNWLLLQPWNNFLLMVIMIWIQTGFAMVVLSAAIKAIPTDVIEAATLDGARGWRLFSRVTVPMVRTTLIVVFTTILIATLKIFDIVRVMTNGNFGTQIVANEMYSQAFVQFDVGRGSALAVILFLGVIPIVSYNIVQLRKERAVR
jgi:alpha-glucoside transport system permease protein